MPDEVTSAAYAMIPAWHGKGVVVPHAMTSREALKKGGVDYLVEQIPLEMVDTDGDGRVIRTRLDDHFANVRSDSRAKLGVVGKVYRIVQNIEAFDFMDDLVTDQILRYEAVVELQGGKKVVIVARMPDTDPIVASDHLSRFIIFVNTHDGSSAIRVFPTSVRIVCMNTLRLALGRASKGDILSIRHSGDIEKKLEDARRVVGLAGDQFGEFAETARELAQTDINDRGWKDYLNAVVPMPDKPSKRQASTVTAIHADINGRYFGSTAQNLPGVRRTLWAALNAVTEHVDHSKPRRQVSDETTWNSTTFGGGNDLKQTALDTAIAFAEV